MNFKRFFVILMALAFLLPSLQLSGGMSCHGECKASCCAGHQPMDESDDEGHAAEPCVCLDCGCPNLPTLSPNPQIKTFSPVPFSPSLPGVLHESTLEVLSPPPES